MAQVTKTRTYASGTPSNLSAANYDADRDEIITGVNDITNAQINASAAIAATKLSGVVTLAGAESISGVKTHSKAINITIANTVNDVALEVTQNDVTNNPNAVTITNAGTGNGLFINQDGNGVALNIDSEATTQPAIQADQTVADDNFSLAIKHAGTVEFGVQRIDDTNDDVCIYLGGSYLWIDSTGDLRIHTSSPTSDTAGVVVGSQS